MPRNRLLAVVAGALIALVPASALARADDRASTKRYLAAATVWLNAVKAIEGPSRAALDALVAHVASNCPGALGANPNATAAQQAVQHAFLVEAGLELGVAELQARRAAARAYQRRLAPLRWSDTIVAGAVAITVRQGRRALGLRPPDLCGEVASAAAGGFATVPPQTVAFLAAAQSALTGSHSVSGLLVLMEPYITPAEGPAAQRLSGLEVRLNRAEAKFGQAAATRLVAALLGR